jgi:hypothetical protein
MSTLLQEVRSALISYSGLTDLLPADKITFARRPQRDQMPGLTVTLGNVDYEPVTQSYAAATTYRVDITVFHKSARECTAIHDQVKLAMLAANSSNFRIRLFDERYFVDVDNIHQGYVTVMWEMDTGVDTTDTVFLSPAFQGADHMKVKTMYKLQPNATTVADLNEQVYFLDMVQVQGGSSSHTFELPLAQENLGKIFTIFTGGQLDSNYTISLTKASGSSEHVQNSQGYQLNRSNACITLVALKTSGTVYGWRIWNYHNLHA